MENKDHKNIKFRLNKQTFPIGIFGSFKYGRLLRLQKLRNFLNSYDYFTQLSEDLDRHFHEPDFKKPIGYDLQISRQLVELSKIHIFVFYREGKNEHHTTDSPAIELFYLLTKIEDGSIPNPKIIIYTQRGVEKEVGGLLKDLILDNRYWRDYPFNNLNDIYEHSLVLCNRFINSP